MKITGLDALDVPLVGWRRLSSRPCKKRLPTPQTPTVVATRPCHRGHEPLRFVTGECVRCFADRRAEQLAISARTQRAHNVARREAIRTRGSHTPADLADILRAQRGKCAYCRQKIGKRRHVDHIMPLALGGTNDRGNLQLLCPSCNRTKSATHPIVHAQRMGKLI